MTEPKIAVVTGAAGGVGGATVRSLVSDGWRVIATVRREEQVAQLNAIRGVSAYALDLLDSDRVMQWANDLVHRETPRIDLVVHTAAIAPVGPAALGDAQTWESTLKTNVEAPALLNAGLLPAVRAAQGTIVFINSGAGERAVARHAIYASSKHALRGYANTLRLEEAQYRVRVASIYPGQIDTKMLRGIDEQLGVDFHPEQYINPQTVADTVLWIANAPDDVHFTNIDVRPRQEVSAQFNV
ncbi:SDR family oxidoreductase [Bifidobacterium apri]|uniref:SDR family oxidoreductase n=1 Tax=Bifidobacterium apri TaxID=1769423 RepID=A0A6A2VB04_9BIFI|nr:SDR family oxidoreductase [Bifidobacterium apri]KAB8301949.1 SDR family oxidoreductase [Bifidobacterium apri]